MDVRRESAAMRREGGIFYWLSITSTMLILLWTRAVSNSPQCARTADIKLPFSVTTRLMQALARGERSRDDDFSMGLCADVVRRPLDSTPGVLFTICFAANINAKICNQHQWASLDITFLVVQWCRGTRALRWVCDSPRRLPLCWQTLQHTLQCREAILFMRSLQTFSFMKCYRHLHLRWITLRVGESEKGIHFCELNSRIEMSSQT